MTLGNILGGAFFVGFLYWFAYRRKCERCDDGIEFDEEEFLSLNDSKKLKLKNTKQKKEKLELIPPEKQ